MASYLRAVEVPRYLVRVLKREVVVLAADVHVHADSRDAARTKVTEMHQKDNIDDRLWHEESAWYTDDAVEVKYVQLDSLF